MAYIKTVEFHGSLIVGETEWPESECTLDFFSSDRARWADGTLTASSFAIDEAFGRNFVKFKTIDGDEFDLSLIAIENGVTRVKSHGKVPGL